MEIPSPSSGKITELKVSVGDKVKQGSLIALLEASTNSDKAKKPSTENTPQDEVAADAKTTESSSSPAPAKTFDGQADQHAALVVLGSGPGGYTAAFPEESGKHGVSFGKPEIDIDKVRENKDGIVKKLTGGLKALSKQRKAGSRVTKLPFIPWEDPRVVDSTGALELEDVPERLLSRWRRTLIPGLMPGADRDLVRPLERRIKKKYENVFTNTKVAAIEPSDDGMVCHFEALDAKSAKGVPESDTFDRVLVSIGRSPNGKLIDAENAGVAVDDYGFINVDNQMRTNVDHIFAIGHKTFFDARAIPSVAYTDPEIAWMGKTEEECLAEGIEFNKGAFPWAASGRSLSNGRNEGLTKVLFDKTSGQLIGAGIVGTNAGELIAEAVLALEMGADAEDIGLTIHPHPTLSETLNFAAEVSEGTCTDIYAPKK
ncbi:Dihydrolipoyl dehydrogenase [Nymphon striatum]|nr:Dihydrolipoyl dehydrogenase [Nymphon striatum]